MSLPSPTFRLAEITIDCRDTTLVGRFWSELLGADRAYLSTGGSGSAR